MRLRSIHILPALLGLLTLAAGCSTANETSEPSEATSSTDDPLKIRIAIDNPFFEPLGANGRACVHCHLADQGWTITPKGVRERFEATQGTDILFRPHDAATSPKADVSTVEARREAYKLILDRAVVRVGIGMPNAATSEFELAAVDDPYGWASAAQLSLFRRPLPTSNLAFARTISWDARLTLPGKTIFEDLVEQANRANKGHGQATTDLPLETRQAIALFEVTTFAAPRSAPVAGRLDQGGALGGVFNLLFRAFDVGDTFAAWSTTANGSAHERERASIARGGKLFEAPRLRRADGSMTSCASCHDARNVGSNTTTALTFDIGTSEEGRRSVDVPLYTFRNKTTGDTRRLTDPGRGLITGKWADLGRFKAPMLRDLAARPPYFHDGSASTLGDVVDHYRDRFDADMSDADRDDLVAFLAAL